MEEIKAPKKERKFLKAIGNIGKVLAEELVMGIARKFIGKAIDKVGNKKQGLVIAFIVLASSFVFAQFPTNTNKQRLGFQTTADGLVWRGSISDTSSIQPVSNQNAWVILDTVNLKIYSFDFTSNVWNQLPSGSTVDTTSLSNRINLKLNISDTAAMLLPYFKDTDTSLLNLVSRLGLKLNISDTAAMLLPYATKAYADTTGRLYARQDYTTGVTTSTLTWTQTDTLIPGGVTFIQVYRNGQILLPSQYTVPTSTSVVISASSFKVNDNYTVIFPRGGGAGSGGGSGSLTSISGGTGITVSPNPITTTGTVSADLSVLMELTDTTLLNLTSRFAAKLNPSDTISLSNRIDTKGSGTVTSIATGYGLSGGTITTSGTLLLDSATVFTRIRDSIVDVAIGNDTIKILKQEYAPALTSVLTWTITPKFPIQLKAYILVFRNGQLLNNDQYNLTDTNKITIVSTSFKVGANYTVATVSGIGSIGTGVFPNPVYPEAGIALSTGSSWASSITNNSSNWNTAFSDRLKWDGGSTGLTASTGRSSLGGTTIGQSMFTLSNPSSITFPRFNANNSVSSLTASELRTAIGAGVGTVTSVTVGSGTPLSINNNNTVPEISMAAATSSVNGYLSSTDWTTFNGKQNALGNASASVNGILTSTDWSTFNNKQNTLTNPVTGTGTTNTLPLFTGTSTLGNSVIQESSGNIGIGVAPTSNLELSKGKFITLNSSGSPTQDSSGIMLYEVGTKTANDINFGAKIMYNGDSDNFEIKMKNFNGTTLFNPPVSISIPRVTGNVNIGTSLAVTGNITEGGNNVMTNLDTVSLSNRIDAKLNKTDTASLSNRIDLKLNKTDTASLSSRIDAKLSPSDTVSLSNRINGKVALSGDETITGFKTFTTAITTANLRLSNTISGTNRLLGLNSVGGAVGQITVGTGLNLTGDVLTATNPTERYYFDLGTVAGQADNVTGTYNFSYSGNAFIVPSSLNGYCIDTVNIRAISCTNCPPSAGEKDYYMGVYKVSAGNRVTSTGATMQGSQIVCNEYDLKEENVNHVLTTGDVWWVYLNGSYFSDMEIIKASFIVKKTCN